MVQQTLQNQWRLMLTSVTRETAGFFSLFHQIRSSSKSHTKCRTKKNDLLPHEPTRCNNVRQREITKQVNISVVRRRTRILDSKTAVVRQKDIQRWRSQHDKYSVLKSADSLQPLRTSRGMQTFYWCMKSAGLVQEFRLTFSNANRRGFMYQLEILGIAPEAEIQANSKNN